MSSMTSVFANALKILNLWSEKEDKWLSFKDLWRRKMRFQPALGGKSEREFRRYLDELVEHRFLLKRWKDEGTRGCYYYAKIDKVQRRSFADLFLDFAELTGFKENRDVLGASIIYSQPSLIDFMTKEEIDEVRIILDKTNSLVAGKISQALIQKRIQELPVEMKEGAYAYPSNKQGYDEMRHRLERSGKVETQKNNDVVEAEIAARAKNWECNTVEDLKGKVGWKYNRMIKDLPLTFDEYREYRNLEAKILPLKKFFEKMENQIQKFLCCFWNYEMEEYILEKHNFVLCTDNILRPTEEVIESLSKVQLKDYKNNLEKAVRSGTFHMPQWTGRDDRYEPKIRISWSNKTARKCLKRILLSINYKLEIDKEEPT